MQLALDHASPIPLFAQIVDSIRWRISVGDLRTGDELPAARAACDAWGVNRHTIGRAYRELEGAGLVRREGKRWRIARVGRKTAGDPEAFVGRVLREAAAHGLSAVELIDSLREQAGLGADRGRPTLIECSRDQCEDLRRQIGERFGVDLDVLALDDLGQRAELPPGPVIGTRFHQEEMLARWPERASDMQFVAASLDPAVGAIVRHLAGEQTPERVLLMVNEDPVAGSNLARDCEALIGGECHVTLRVLRDDPVNEMNELESIVLATPHAWQALAAQLRDRPEVIRLRYAIETDDLDRLARLFDWKPTTSSGPRASHPH